MTVVLLGKLRTLAELAWQWLFEGCGNCAASYLRGLKPVIFIGRILLVLPRNVLICNKEESRTAIKMGIIRSVILAILFFVNFILQTIANTHRYHNLPSTYEKLHELILPVYSFNIFFIYTYFLLSANKLKSLITKMFHINMQPVLNSPFHCTSSSQTGNANCDPEFQGLKSFVSVGKMSYYPRFCLLAMTCIMIYGIIENVTYDVQNIATAGPDIANVNSTLERYYIRSYYHWEPYMSYNPWITLCFVVLMKFGTYAWIFGDIVVIVLCRAVAERLIVLNDEIKQTLDPLPAMSMLTTVARQKRSPTSDEFRPGTKSSLVFTLWWDEVRSQYMALQDLVRDIGKFITPLILSCYGINVYLSIIHLFYWIAPNISLSDEQTFYSYFAFAHFSFRISSVTYFAADIYHAAICLSVALEKCPNSLYTLSMERLEKSVISNPCGISLFGTFVITRKFFISIIGFVFTTEIVLLQTTK